MFRLYHGKIRKVVSPQFETFNLGSCGGDDVCSVNVRQLSNLRWISLKRYREDWNILLWSKDVSIQITLSSLGVVLSLRYKNKKRTSNVTHVRVFAAVGSTLFLTFQFCVRSVVSAQSFARAIYSRDQGAYIVGGETRLQSADRCVMRQRTGTSVFYERLREGAWFCSFVFVRLLLRFFEKFQGIFNWYFRSNVSFNVQELFVFIGLFLLCFIVDKRRRKSVYEETRNSARKYDKSTCCPK